MLWLFLSPLLLLLFLSQTWVESPLYSSKRQTMATTRHLHINLTATKNIIPKPTQMGTQKKTLRASANPISFVLNFILASLYSRLWVWSEEEEAWTFSLYSTRNEWSSRHSKNIPVEIFSSNWRQCAVRGVVIKNLFLSASSLLAQAMLEVLIFAPIICLFICLSVPLFVCAYFSIHPF